jgi:hypothetical protein
MHKLSRCLVALGLGGVLLFTAVPAHADAEGDAGDAIEEYMTAAFDGDWATTYTMLPSAQSALLSEADWEACQEQRNGGLVGAELEDFEVVGSKKLSYRIPGTDEKAPALAVKIEVTASLDGQTQSDADKVFVVRQGKSWRPSIRQTHVDACLGTTTT